MQKADATVRPKNETLVTSLLNAIQETARLFSFPSREGVSEKAKLLWLIKLRWIATTLFLFLAIPGIIFGNLNRTTMANYIGILGVLIIFNLLSQLVIAESKRKIGPLVICFQLAFDLIVLSGLLVISGGFVSPFISLFFLNASLGGILISGRLSWPFLLLTHTLLGVLQFRFVIDQQHDINKDIISTFTIYHVLVLGFWLVMRSLGSYLEKQSQRQSQSQIALEKQDRLRSIGALAAGFSHEFASPLNVAKIRLERLKRQNSESEDVTEALKAIVICENVIHQMNSSQLDSRDFQFKTIVLSDLLHDVIDSWKEDKPTAQLSLNIQKQIEASVPPINFSQVVMNLLDNAFEANPKGLIRVELLKSKNKICFSVEDDGPGFHASVLRQKGEPFVTTKKNGTGLGLYVSELFAQSLAGHLKLNNRLEKGAIVSMSWPTKGMTE
jgi:two-component system, sensor histidine kinase RegB